MQKAGFSRIILLVLMLYIFPSKALIAQTAPDTLGFNYKLVEVADPTIEAKLQFNQLIPNTSININWDFGDGNTATGDNPLHSYDITVKDTFTVRLYFQLNLKDSSIKRKVAANSAGFFERIDPNTKVTYVRIIKSAFLFPDNDPTLLGNMRFEWTINGTLLSDETFTVATFGQHPNIRYTFENSGPNTVTLRAWSITDPTKDISFTRILNIQPGFTTKEKFTDVPNVFTPNGDNIFDDFIVSTSGLSRLVFKVFTRSGSLVYQRQANFIRWDGKNDNGKDLPEGIYYYIIEDLDGFYENAKGFVYIFRGN